MKVSTLLGCLVVILVPALGAAQELVADETVVMKARVVEVVSEHTETLPGTDVTTTLQTIRAEILDGPEAGNTVTVENDFLELEPGDVFYLQHTTSRFDGTDYYSVSDKVRTPALAILAALFIAVVVIFGGKQGIRGLIALIASFIFIGTMLLPGILSGYSPVLVSVGVAAIIVTLGSYVTHGFNRTTSAAVVGMVVTIVFTGILAYVSLEWTDLSGWSGDEVTYLHLNTRGSIDLAGVLLGGILIGLLGVLYDAAIGQAVSVEELARAGKHYTRRDVYLRALRIGREHVGALVNTLAIAYAGAALPLLLLFYGLNDLDIIQTLNRELFATEIVRILVGSIGLVLAVPITTAVAVWMLLREEARDTISS
ncbi:MAG TPA: YibE/F family protein [Candidatus Paceibacterota bacterium]|nr:YibE/F family protein [Candidatus Paceibacterota bacterium]